MIVSKKQPIFQNGSYGIMSFTGKYVIKEVLKIKEDAGDYDIEQTSIHEIVLLKLYNHPNIVKPVTIKSSFETFKIYMNNEGIDLHTYIHSTATNIRIDNLPNIFYQISCGLKYIHDNGLQHGDLKTSNILYSDTVKLIKLIDFGGLTSFRIDNTHKSACTLNFRAPEVCTSPECISGAMDIWGLGITLSCYLYMDYPLNCQDDTSYIEDINDKISKGFKSVKINKFVQYVTNSLRILNENMLIFDHRNRITIDEIIAHELFNNVRKIYENNYMACKKIKNNRIITNYITSDELIIRRESIEWIFNKCSDSLCKTCFYLAVRIYDRYIGKYTKKESIKHTNNYELIRIISFYISEILIQENYNFITDIHNDYKYPVETIITQIDKIMNTLHYKLYEDTFDYIILKRDGDIDYNLVYEIAQNTDMISYTQRKLVRKYYKLSSKYDQKN